MAPRETRDGTRVDPGVGVYRSKAVRWVFLTGNRAVLALVITGAFAAFFVTLLALDVVTLAHAQPLFYAYGGLIAGNLTLITVIVSINQLFLSRELRSPGELQTQIENIVEYREGVEEATGVVAPSTPLRFLLLLVEATRQNAQRVGGFAMDGVVDAGNQELEEIATTLTEQMDEIQDAIEGADPNTFKVLSVMLGTNYSEQLHRLRVARTEHRESISDVAHDAIDDLITRLHDLDVSRQYFRSIYLQEELSALSRILLYTGLPSVAIAVGTLVVLTVPPDRPADVAGLPLLLVVTLTVGMVPLAILCSFFLRTATITKLTAATVPFTTPEDARL